MSYWSRGKNFFIENKKLIKHYGLIGTGIYWTYWGLGLSAVYYGLEYKIIKQEKIGWIPLENYIIHF